MGYRSDIYIKIDIKKLFEVSEFLEKMKKTYDMDLSHQELVKHTKNYIYIHLQDWKFYENYPEVQDIKIFVDSLEEHAGMIEIGEDGATATSQFAYEVDLNTTTIIEGFDNE